MSPSFATNVCSGFCFSGERGWKCRALGIAPAACRHRGSRCQGAASKETSPYSPSRAQSPCPPRDKPLHTTRPPSSDVPARLRVSRRPPPRPCQPHCGLARETGSAKLAHAPSFRAAASSRHSPASSRAVRGLPRLPCWGSAPLPRPRPPSPPFPRRSVASRGQTRSLSPFHYLWEHVSFRVILKGSKLSSLPRLPLVGSRSCDCSSAQRTQASLLEQERRGAGPSPPRGRRDLLTATGSLRGKEPVQDRPH